MLINEIKTCWKTGSISISRGIRSSRIHIVVLTYMVRAVQAFLEICQADPALRTRAESRLPHLLAIVPIKR